LCEPKTLALPVHLQDGAASHLVQGSVFNLLVKYNGDRKAAQGGGRALPFRNSGRRPQFQRGRQQRATWIVEFRGVQPARLGKASNSPC